MEGSTFAKFVTTFYDSNVLLSSEARRFMQGVLKKGAGLLVILFFGFWLVQDPSGFADSLKSTGSTIWDLLMKLFDSSITFIKSLSD